jgi:hypothetical protein
MMLAFVIIPAVISWDSFTNIVRFKDSAEPVTRREIVFLLLEAFNFGAYLLFAMTNAGVVIGTLLKERKQKKSALNEAEKENPSEEGLSG